MLFCVATPPWAVGGVGVACVPTQSEFMPNANISIDFGFFIAIFRPRSGILNVVTIVLLLYLLFIC